MTPSINRKSIFVGSSETGKEISLVPFLFPDLGNGTGVDT